MLEEAFKGIGYGIEEGKVYEREQKRRQNHRLCIEMV